MKPPTITAYLNLPAAGARACAPILRKYDLPYEDRDIINNQSLYAEMVEKSGQSLSPCVEIDGQMLADVSGDEVEVYLLTAGLVQPADAVTSVPTNRGCADHH
jgi:hypothetical protein